MPAVNASCFQCYDKAQALSALTLWIVDIHKHNLGVTFNMCNTIA